MSTTRKRAPVNLRNRLNQNDNTHSDTKALKAINIPDNFREKIIGKRASTFEMLVIYLS